MYTTMLPQETKRCRSSGGTFRIGKSIDIMYMVKIIGSQSYLRGQSTMYTTTMSPQETKMSMNGKGLQVEP